MSETPRPDQSESLPAVNAGDAVYAHLPGHNPSIKRGVVSSQQGPDAWVNLGNGHSRRVHRSQLFTPVEVAQTAEDLMLSHPVGEEVHVTKAIEEVADHPIAADELSTRLDIKAMERYLAPDRTLEELGVRSEEELLAGADVRGSNRWKITELIQGVENGEYQSGANNDLSLAAPTKDIEVLPDEEAKSVKQKINDVNRHVLDTLYDQYGADFEHAVVLERRAQQGMIERRTVIPSTAADFSFVETAYIPESADTDLSQVNYAQIVVGKPEYSLDDGYLPAV